LLGGVADGYDAPMDHESVTILDGGTAEGSTERTSEALRRDCARCGYEVTTFRLRDLSIAPCTGCFSCWVRTPGLCVVDDAARTIAAAVIRSGLIVLLTPITFGGYSSELKKAMDRMIPLILPFFARIEKETHHVPRYPRFPRILAVGVGPATTEEERLFGRLARRNATNLHAPREEAFVLPHDGEGETALLSAMRRLLAP
jgi:hypothetical protein